MLPFSNIISGMGSSLLCFAEGRSKECNLLAIQSLYDPQEFADKLFRMLESKKIDKYEVSKPK